ncbi:hypothetical protein [Pseudomonas eucalypticola]|uniref:Uncharacterized protein n=1 Tax=Pseudomonas eucalypticola TaxID=2599595 RepID=A0A7D5H5V0_9PSED|nr:hypothetical protein [Pseudomonas eucalypticola]QKZ03784.1 hypothetical protein HWQ56_08300 [Pseudomonas eucalypticola]
MENINYLKSTLPKKTESWVLDLNEILSSDSLHVGTPYEESVRLLLFKINQRVVKSGDLDKKTIGLAELAESLSLLVGEEKVRVYPMKSDVFSGDCIVVNDEMIGCAFIELGCSLSRRGLWIGGNKID